MQSVGSPCRKHSFQPVSEPSLVARNLLAAASRWGVGSYGAGERKIPWEGVKEISPASRTSLGLQIKMLWIKYLGFKNLKVLRMVQYVVRFEMMLKNCVIAYTPCKNYL
jgi:hypothetical protein